ncbi:MAG: DUF4012 domain-containing protein [Patescibacteria group bacterium]|nr:DUF4012 domain-containing protein [Patescibacteria group bacterium]
MSTINTVDFKLEKKDLKTRILRVLKDRKFWKKVVISTGVLVFILALIGAIGYFLFYPKIKDLSNQLKVTMAQAKKVNVAVQDQNVVTAKEELTTLKEAVEKTEKSFDSLGFFSSLPWVGGYFSDARHAFNAGYEAIDAGLIITDSLIPFADTLGLKGVASSDTAENKMQKIVQAIPKIVPNLDKIEAKLKLVRGEIDQVDPNRYPEEFLGYKIKSTIGDAKSQIDNIESFMPEIRPILLALPPALGEPSPKTYLILFQNDKELRATGGFITSYAIAKINQGKLGDIKSDDIYNMDDRINAKFPVPQPVRDYLKLSTYHLRDANLSPDFVTSMQEVEKFYNKYPAKEKIDGIIALDTEFVRSLLEVTGPIKTSQYGESFSADLNDKGIPDVVYKLELYSEQLLMGKENRKALIGDLMSALLAKVLNAPQKQWQPLMNIFMKTAQEKHFLTYSHDPKVQSILEKYDWAGRVKDYKGDYLHVNDSNFAGGKANLYIKEKIEQNIKIDSDGTVTKTVTVTLKNPQANDGWLNKLYYDWMRIYVPEGSKLESSKAWQDVTVDQELGKTFFKTYTHVYPKDSNSVTVTYKLPFKLSKGEEYKLLMQKQPGTNGPEVVIKINGKEKEKFTLTTDKEVKIKI